MTDSEVADEATGEAGTGRTEAFSDGVLAVAITLLVVGLAVPSHRPGHLGSALLDLWPSYVSFLASFAFVGVIWLNHHAIFRQVRRVDRALNWANLALLLGAVVLPFPTSVLSDALRSANRSDERAAVVLYALVEMYIAVAWFVLYQVLRRRRALTHAVVEADQLRLQQFRAVVGVVAFAAAGLVGLAVPYAALGAFVGLPIFYGITSEGLRGR